MGGKEDRETGWGAEPLLRGGEHDVQAPGVKADSFGCDGTYAVSDDEGGWGDTGCKGGDLGGGGEDTWGVSAVSAPRKRNARVSLPVEVSTCVNVINLYLRA